jgi:hypothetical protein
LPLQLALLADTYVVYLKTHNFHWNVEGPMFQTLHQMFMEQYTETWNAIDLVAERIRSLGHYAPGTYAEYNKLARIKETAWSSQGGANGAAADRRAGSDREDRARSAADRREGRRPADARPAHAAHADPREERLDAALAGRTRCPPPPCRTACLREPPGAKLARREGHA